VELGEAYAVLWLCIFLPFLVVAILGAIVLAKQRLEWSEGWQHRNKEESLKNVEGAHNREFQLFLLLQALADEKKMEISWFFELREELAATELSLLMPERYQKKHRGESWHKYPEAYRIYLAAIRIAILKNDPALFRLARDLREGLGNWDCYGTLLRQVQDQLSIHRIPSPVREGFLRIDHQERPKRR